MLTIEDLHLTYMFPRTLALTFITLAFDRVEDLEGRLACLERKAAVFRYRGEEDLAGEMEGMVDALVEEKRQRLREIEERGLE